MANDFKEMITPKQTKLNLLGIYKHIFPINRILEITLPFKKKKHQLRYD